MASELPHGWTLTSMRAVVSFFAGGDSFLKLEYSASGIPVLAKGDVKPFGRLKHGDKRFMDPRIVAERHYRTSQPDDYLLTTRDLTQAADFLGLLAPIPSHEHYLVNQGANVVRFTEAVDGRYLVYWCNGPRYRAYVKGHYVGSTQIHLRKDDFLDAPLLLPPLDEQHAIARILGTLDHKIELNRRMNETLEAMALALFKSWFVGFDPVRAKAEGRDPGLPKLLANLFSDRFEDSELGEIPAGWHVASVGDLCHRIAMGPFGSDIKTDNFVDSGVPVVRGSNLTDGFVEDAFAFVSDQKADQLRNANAFPGDIVITHRGTLGQVGLIPERSRFPRYVVSQSQMLLSVNREVATPRYVFDYLRCASGQHALLANTSQTGVPAIARPTSSVRAIQLVAPPIEALRSFSKIVDPIYMRRDRGIEESRTLAALRDALLPKLISGEIRVDDAERRVEAVL